MQLARKAQRAAAVNVAEAFAPLGSPDSEALHMITGYVPEPEEDDEEPERPELRVRRGAGATAADPQSAPPPAEPPRRPNRPTRRDDDDDFSNDDLFGR